MALPPGTGEVDALTAGCRDGALGIFVLRGHVLSWTSRRTALGEALRRPIVVATGADRLGPTATDAPEGPVAWRSPIAGLDTAERDDVWAARVVFGDGGRHILRGDVVMPAGVVGLGLPFARNAGSRIEVRAAFAREGHAPATSTLGIIPGRDAPTEIASPAPAFAGQIEAWEPTRGVALARVDGDDGAWFEARYPDGRSARHRLGAPEAVVVPRGVAIAHGVAFLVGAFALGRDGDDGGPCVRAPGGPCVRPGPVSLLLAGEDGVIREQRLAARGVPDTLAAEGDTLLALYVDPGDGPATTQRGAIFDPGTREVTPFRLGPVEGFPPIDTPEIVHCARETWLVASVALSTDGGSRVGITALPLECLVTE